MSMSLKATFATRREAEMAVERLVQEYAIERADIFIVADSSENTAGEHAAGSDVEVVGPTSAARDDAPLGGPIEVAVDIDDDALAGQVRSAFSEFAAASVEQD